MDTAQRLRERLGNLTGKVSIETKEFPERCSDVAITYELAIRNSKDFRAEHLLDLDRRIAAETNSPISYNIGRRIAFFRHRAAHGNSIAVESDGNFLQPIDDRVGDD